MCIEWLFPFVLYFRSHSSHLGASRVDFNKLLFTYFYVTILINFLSLSNCNRLTSFSLLSRFFEVFKILKLQSNIIRYINKHDLYIRSLALKINDKNYTSVLSTKVITVININSRCISLVT